MKHFRNNLKNLQPLIAALALTTCCVGAMAQDKVIHMAGTLDTKNSESGKFVEKVYTEAFHRLGYKLSYDGYPAKRSSEMSDSGEADGEINRVADYGKEHPNLIRVEEPHSKINFSAYSGGPSPVEGLNGWDSLKGKAYMVNYRRGVTKTEVKLTGMIDANKLEVVNATAAGLKKVASGRADIYIDVEDVIEDALAANPDIKGVKKAGLMESISIHAFLHKKNAELVPKLAATLKAMKQEGLFVKYSAELKGK